MAPSLLDTIFGAPTGVAIDIGSTAIKLMECRVEGGRPVAARLGMAPTPPGAMSNGLVVDPLIIGEVIRELVLSTGCTAKLAICGVTDPSLVATRIQVPRRDPGALAKAIPFEARAHIPFGAEEGEIAWQILDPDSDDPQMNVLIVAARNEAVEGRTQAIEQGGLTPTVMDAVQLASLRAQVYASQDARVYEQTILLLHIGAAFTEMTVVYRGCFGFPRIVPIAGQSMDHAVAAAFSVDPDEGRRIKETQAVACTRDEIPSLPQEQQQASLAIAPVLEEIVREIRRHR